MTDALASSCFWPAVLACGLVLVVVGGCEGKQGTLPPCGTPERAQKATQVAPMPQAVRDSIRQAFTAQHPRVRETRLEQAGCHLRAFVRVDSFSTAAYATDRGFALLRTIKENAPNETRPFVQDPASDVGTGLYDYAVTFERAGTPDSSGDSASLAPSGSGQKAWVRLTKPHHDRLVSVRR